MDAPTPIRAERTVGTLVAGRYRLTEFLAVGGMGAVWAARDERLGRDVALKFVRDDLVASDEVLERFRHEARTVASIAHPDVAQLHDLVETTDGRTDVFLVMELVRGRTLAQVLRDDRRPDRRVVLHVLERTAAALAAAHRLGVVHRDVKPGNILVGADGRVKLTDFGIARVAEAAPTTRDGLTAGTVAYMAPEQRRGDAVGPWSDVYGFGVVAHEMLAGELPFPDGHRIGDVPPELPADVDPRLRLLVMECLRPDSTERPADGEVLVRRLDDLRPLRVTERAPVAHLVDAARRPDAAEAVTEVMPASRSAAVAAAAMQRSPISGPVPATAVHPVAREVIGVDPRQAPRTHRAWWAALVAVALVVSAVLALRALAGDASPLDPSTSATATTSAGGPVVAGVEVRADDVVGRRVEDVTAWFEAQGVSVQVQPIADATRPAGEVLAVEPVGTIAPGSTLTLSVAEGGVPPVVSVAAVPPSTPVEGGPTDDTPGKGKDRSDKPGRGNGSDGG